MRLAAVRRNHLAQVSRRPVYWLGLFGRGGLRRARNIEQGTKRRKSPTLKTRRKKKNRLNRKCMAFSFPLGGWRKRGAFLTNRISRGRHVACSRHSPFAIVFSEYRSGEILRATEAEGASTPPAQYLADLVCGMPTGILRSREKIFRFNRRAADAGPARPRPKGVRLYRHFAATSKDKIKM